MKKFLVLIAVIFLLSNALTASVPSDMNVSVNVESVSTYTTDEFVPSDMNILENMEFVTPYNISPEEQVDMICFIMYNYEEGFIIKYIDGTIEIYYYEYLDIYIDCFTV
jgi:hypothetical protein